jgi:hypothetical protein
MAAETDETRYDPTPHARSRLARLRGERIALEAGERAVTTAELVGVVLRQSRTIYDYRNVVAVLEARVRNLEALLARAGRPVEPSAVHRPD